MFKKTPPRSILVDPTNAPDSLKALTPLQATTGQPDLDRTLVRGVAWTAVGKWLTQAFTWGTTLLIARVLLPSDYGLVGMATLYLGLVTLFSEFGIGTAVITLRELSDDQASELNSVSLLLGFVGFLISAAAAIPLGKFFRSPGLPAVVIVMSTAFLFGAVRTVPYSLLTKDMRFKTLAIIDGVQGIVQAFSTLLFAFLGLRYWALVLGNVSTVIVATSLTLICRRQRFAWPRFKMLRKPLLFSWHVVAGTLSWYAYDNSDFLVAGRMLGQAPLGAYTLAWTLAHAPLEKLTTVVNRVTRPIYSAIQSDSVALRRYLLKITGALALVIFPATIGMALVAPDFVHVVLGAKWAGAVLPLEFLALHATIRSNVILLGPVLDAIREARFGMWTSLVTLVVLVVSFYLASRWGTGGIAAVWVVVYPVMQLPFYWLLRKRIHLSLNAYLKVLWPALSGCILMAVAVGIVRKSFNPVWPTYLRLVAEVSAGALVYVLTLASMHWERLNAFLRLVNSLRRQSA